MEGDMDTNNTSREQKQTEGNVQQPQPSVERQSPTPYHSASQYHCRKEKKDWPQRVEACCAIALVIITFFYTYYARQQSIAANNTLIEIHNQSPEIKQSADAAKDAAETAHSALVLDVRPWVGLIGSDHITADLKENSPLQVHLQIENFGKSPALKEASFTSLTSHPRNKPMPRFDSYSKKDAGPTVTLMPTAIANVDISTDAPSNKGLKLILEKGDIERITSGDVQLFIYGSIWYQDTFGQPHRTDYCLQYVPGTSAQVRGSFGACPTHNTAD
jgi:hypothetical protein